MVLPRSFLGNWTTIDQYGLTMTDYVSHCYSKCHQVVFLGCRYDYCMVEQFSLTHAYPLVKTHFIIVILFILLPLFKS